MHTLNPEPLAPHLCIPASTRLASTAWGRRITLPRIMPSPWLWLRLRLRVMLWVAAGHLPAAPASLLLLLLL